ncbi:PREDICTED: meprin A subunit alpha-like [Priapulus caudatus]|uniref:Metalloendopeptidase n=1 Tax=Priapulus caudatus TaxID=37621 RepID=A0ABM1F3A2_PRICU|nr:PREDICTED: meprin A subunit alpha-like [Priapulus caudatus]
MTAIHEMMHAAGFYHTQSRYDRDAYVDIYWENIMDGYEYNFDMYDSSHITLYNKYDLKSVMHYQTWAFSKNGRPTITAKNDPNATIYLGQPHDGGGFTTSDIVKLNEMYNC